MSHECFRGVDVSQSPTTSLLKFASSSLSTCMEMLAKYILMTKMLGKKTPSGKQNKVKHNFIALFNIASVAVATERLLLDYFELLHNKSAVSLSAT